VFKVLDLPHYTLKLCVIEEQRGKEGREVARKKERMNWRKREWNKDWEICGN